MHVLQFRYAVRALCHWQHVQRPPGASYHNIAPNKHPIFSFTFYSGTSVSMGSNNEGDKTIRQYVATKKGGPFAVVRGPYPTPGPAEICICNVAIGLNPLDWKNLYHGEMVKAWPEIFGIDTAGIVVAVGEDVTSFKLGDAVMSLAGHGGRAGAFQEVTTVPAHFASKKPAGWSFEEASSVP